LYGIVIQPTDITCLTGGATVVLITQLGFVSFDRLCWAHRHPDIQTKEAKIFVETLPITSDN
jgi:hypothetical protein